MTAGVLCLGLAVRDYVFSVPDLPVSAGKHRASDLAAVGGGPAANASVAIARLHGAAILATRLGGDSLGDGIVAELEAEGVDTRFAARFADCRSPLSAVMVDAAGERMVVNYRDPALPDDPAWLPEPASLELGAVLADARWAAGAGALLHRAREAGLPAVLDAEPPMAELAGAVHAATHIAFSRDGLADWTGIRTPDAALTAVAAETGAFVCATDGRSGVRYAHGDRHGRVAAFPVDAVDTLAAGDVWHGAFALALAEGRGEAEAIRFASAAAALKCTRFGGRAGIPTRPEVESFMMEQTG